MSYLLATNGYVEGGVFKEISTGKQPNLFKRAEIFVNRMRSIHSVVAITYVKGGLGGDEIETCATPAMTTFVYTDENNMSQRKQSRDYLLNTIDLQFAAINFKPVKGDLIFEDVDGIRFTYEVGAFNSEPDWRYSGIYRQALRIHSKKIDEGVVV